MKLNSLVPELDVTDLKASLHFYQDVIGFKVEYRRVESNFAFISFQGNQLMLETRNGNWETGQLERPFGRGINFQMLVDKVDPIITQLNTAGWPIMKGPWERHYRKDQEQIGQREFLVQDPDGYLLRFAELLP